MLFFQFLIMALTGIILYFTPPGRIARWTDWRFMGMGKDQLEGIHTVSSFVFFIMALVHILNLNFRALWGYLRGKATSGIRRPREIGISLLLSLLVFLGTYLALPPFSTVMDWGNTLKSSWGTAAREAPVPEAHALTLEEFSRQVLGRDGRRVLDWLRVQGMRVTGVSETIESLARRNGLSPADLHAVLQAMPDPDPGRDSSQ